MRERQNADKGIELIEKIRELATYNPDQAALNRNLGELYAIKGDKDKAKENYGERFINCQVGLLTSSLVQYASLGPRPPRRKNSRSSAFETDFYFIIHRNLGPLPGSEELHGPEKRLVALLPCPVQLAGVVGDG